MYWLKITNERKLIFFIQCIILESLLPDWLPLLFEILAYCALGYQAPPPPLNISFNDKNISIYFLCENCKPYPPEKSHPLFPSNPPLKVEVLSSSPPFWKLGLKIWLEVQPPSPPPAERGGGSCMLWLGNMGIVLVCCPVYEVINFENSLKIISVK